jgi:hypothetical protein
MSHRLFPASCATIWIASILACKGDKGASTTIEQVGDGPAVVVASRPQAGLDTEAAKSALSRAEAAATESVLAVTVAADLPPEVKTFAETLMAVRRAKRAADVLAPRKLDRLNLNDLHVGEAGTADETCRVVRVDDEVLVLSTAAHQMFAVSGLNTANAATDQSIAVSGSFEAYRTGKFGIYTLVVIRSIAPDGTGQLAHRWATDRLGAMKIEHAKSAAALKAARDRAVTKAINEAEAEASRRFPVPKAGPVQDRIKAQRNYDEALPKLVKAAKEEAEARYAEPK